MVRSTTDVSSPTTVAQVRHTSCILGLKGASPLQVDRSATVVSDSPATLVPSPSKPRRPEVHEVLPTSTGLRDRAQNDARDDAGQGSSFVTDGSRVLDLPRVCDEEDEGEPGQEPGGKAGGAKAMRAGRKRSQVGQKSGWEEGLRVG